MKITRYGVIFLLAVLILLVSLQMRIDKFTTFSDRKVQYNNALDSAIDSALDSVVISADRDVVEINKELCVDNYYKALYAAFDATDNPDKQDMLRLYTPVLALADDDGLWVYYSRVEKNGEGSIKKVWSEKTPYSRTFSIPNTGAVNGNINFTLNFSMSDNLIIKILGDSNVYSGSWVSLQERYVKEVNKNKPIYKVLTSEYLAAEGYYQLWRKQVITDTIMERLSYYVNRHNEIASFYGESFTFSLPLSSSSDVARAIDSVSFISFFQGYPYGRGTDEVYSNFEISGARISKSLGYYVRSIKQNGQYFNYYHKPDCDYGEGTDYWYKTREECALQGALPCPYCKP